MFPSRSFAMRPSRPMLMAVPKHNENAHTISQRLRTLKKIPPELVPLGAVLLVAVGFAAYSSVHKLFSDKTLRLSRSRPEQH